MRRQTRYEALRLTLVLAKRSAQVLALTLAQGHRWQGAAVRCGSPGPPQDGYRLLGRNHLPGQTLR